MPSITDSLDDPAKIMLIGKSGAGKTGSLAALVAAGYKLRIIDTDKGFRPLRSLLTDDHYPYARIIKSRSIDLNQAVRYVPIDTSMKLRSVPVKTPTGGSRTDQLLAPVDAKAWTRMLDLLDKWKEGDVDYGSVRTWGTDHVLVIDSFSTLAKCAYYFNQALNARLGAADSGYDYQRDVGGAQSHLTRLLELLYDSSVGCHVIVISHITWVDESYGVASRPQEKSRDGSTMMSQADGYPSAIGRALSPHIGKYFNDVYIVRATGSGSNVSRTISTVPQEGVSAKHSVYLERDYPIGYGLASIFAALCGKEPPKDLIEAFARKPAVAASPAPTNVSSNTVRPVGSAVA